jgi:hypothetical protein
MCSQSTSRRSWTCGSAQTPMLFCRKGHDAPPPERTPRFFLGQLSTLVRRPDLVDEPALEGRAGVIASSAQLSPSTIHLDSSFSYPISSVLHTHQPSPRPSVSPGGGISTHGMTLKRTICKAGGLCLSGFVSLGATHSAALSSVLPCIIRGLRSTC